MTTEVVEKYDVVVRDVFRELVKFGFKKKKSFFWKEGSESRTIVEFQKSQRSTKENIFFTLNLSIIYKVLLDSEFDNIERMRGHDGHVFWRIGDFLSPRVDKWWIIDDNVNVAAVSAEIASVLTEDAMPTLDTYSTVESVLKLWKSGVSPGVSEKRRLEYVTEITRARGIE